MEELYTKDPSASKKALTETTAAPKEEVTAKKGEELITNDAEAMFAFSSALAAE